MKDTALIDVGDLQFSPFLSADTIQHRVRELGQQLARDYAHRQPFFLIMLKGAFIFAADLIRSSGLPAEVGFVRLSSYIGTQTTRKVTTLLPPDPAEVQGRDIIIVEDIVDSGHTLHHFIAQLTAMQPHSVAVVSLLHKPDAREVDVPLDYVGFEIPTKFVVGYGLDYAGQGRQLAGIYQLA